MADEQIEQLGPDEPITDDLVPNVCKFFCIPEIKAVNKELREVSHVITSNNPDRVGDIVEAGGAQLDNYLRNPVVLADHTYSISEVIGKAITLSVEAGRIFTRTKYFDTPLARDAFNLVKEGLGAWSIGFRPLKYAAMKDEKGMTKGFRFSKWELLEYSQVAIPMNPDAVQNAITRGMSNAAHKEWLVNAARKSFAFIEQPAEPATTAPLEANAEPVETVQPVRVHPPALKSSLRAIGAALLSLEAAKAAHRIRITHE